MIVDHTWTQGTYPGGTHVHARHDSRFTYGLLADLCGLLHKHGYNPPADKEANHRALRRAFEDLYRLVRDFESVTLDEPATTTHRGGTR